MKRRQLAIALPFILPNLLGFMLFTAGPVLFSLCIAFSNWNLMRSVPFAWTGLENFVTLWHDKDFWLYFANTLYFLIGMPFAIAGSLALALLLSQKIKGLVVYRTLLYLPSFTSGVALMILWKALYNPDFGPINYAIEALGLHAPQWLLSTQNIVGLGVEKVGFDAKQLGLGARDAIIIMGVWTAIGGSNMLLYLAALTNVPQDLTEAAELDGANRWQVFRNVTWPQLAPTTFFITVMSFIGGLQGGFEQARVMTGGGPAGTTTTLSYYIYTKAFEEFQIGYASAISWVLFSIIFVITVINWKFGNKEVAY
ncbi:sugar ABC transporter permease [Armatimonas sp.]|uniref:carbohydrate ABC transporter permease n=1 Tax=Armatimonas sp. TaxID=1872638 RepID=UPI00286D5E60|nr:sugar ABC transporter permease [Armatimonas sp.]